MTMSFPLGAVFLFWVDDFVGDLFSSALASNELVSKPQLASPKHDYIVYLLSSIF